jgi:hypothetical protein
MAAKGMEAEDTGAVGMEAKTVERRIRIRLPYAGRLTGAH